MPTLQDMQAADDAYNKQAKDAQDAEASKSNTPPDIFMMTLPAQVTSAFLHEAVARADRMGNLTHPLYHHVRDAVVTFSSEYDSGNKLEAAIARLCVPLLGYARILGNVRIVAHTAQMYADRGVKPQQVNFAELHALGQHTQQYLSVALHEVSSHAHVDYVNFIAGSVSEEELAAHLRTDGAKAELASILATASAVLKDGLQASRSAAESGVRTTDDMLPESTGTKMQRYADSIGAVHVRKGVAQGDGVQLGGRHFTPDQLDATLATAKGKQ